LRRKLLPAARVVVGCPIGRIGVGFRFGGESQRERRPDLDVARQEGALVEPLAPQPRS
jgi:hypothetical protein